MSCRGHDRLFPHHVQNQVALHQIVTSKAVIDIDTSSWPIVAKVVTEGHIGSKGLEVTRRLLAEHANLPNVVVCHQNAVGERVCSAKDRICRSQSCYSAVTDVHKFTAALIPLLPM